MQLSRQFNAFRNHGQNLLTMPQVRFVMPHDGRNIYEKLPSVRECHSLEFTILSWAVCLMIHCQTHNTSQEGSLSGKDMRMNSRQPKARATHHCHVDGVGWDLNRGSDHDSRQFFGWTWLRSGPMEPEFPPSPPKPQQFGPEAGWMYPMPLHRDPIYEYEGRGLTNCHLCSIKQNMNTKCGRKMPRTSCCDGFQGLWQRLDCLVVWNVFLFNNFV